jgi:hypothetical protein
MKRITPVLAAALLGLLLVLIVGGPAFAGALPAPAADQLPPLQVLGFRQVDLDGNGRPDEAVIDCACVTAHDQVLVYDGADNMQAATDWKAGTDIADDTWVLDSGARGHASLIIKFRTAADRQVAELYDDVNGDGIVSYHIEKRHVVVDESAYWSMQVIAHTRWFLADGRPNLNLSVMLDKSAPNSFEFLDAGIANKYMRHDGRPDVAFDLVDSANTGVADYALARLLTDIPASIHVGRARLWVNTGHQPSRSPESALFWPFLDFRPLLGQQAAGLRFFDLLPRVTVDWSRAVVGAFALPGYPIGAGYWLNSLDPISFDRVNDADYEMPHAWYNLAGDHDGDPDLNIRLFAQPNGPWREIRYSWNQSNPHTLLWDYKLGMMGDPVITDVVSFPNFGLRMVPYERLPYWVTGQTWKLNTFVAREGGKQESSEGIYAWSPWSGVDPTLPDNPGDAVFAAATSYLSGASTVTPAGYFTTIGEGYRGEYNLTRPLPATLYFSPVDRRLHLKGAEHGLLNLDGLQSVTYDNKDGDDYLEQWSAWTGTTLSRTLYKAGSFLIYSGEGAVMVRQANVPNAVFETAPPRNHDEWAALGARLQSQGIPAPPADLRAMLDQFSGPTMQVTGAGIREYRRVGQEGFRFVLVLAADSRLQGGGLLADQTLAPGDYVVTYDSRLAIRPLAPAALSAGVRASSLTQLQPGAVFVGLRNDGLLDVPGATLELWAAAPQQPARLVATQTATLLASATLTATLQWTPPTAGDWTLTPKLGQPGAAPAEFPGIQVRVAPAPPVTAAALLAASTVPGGYGFLALALTTLALLAALIIWRQSQVANEESR